MQLLFPLTEPDPMEVLVVGGAGDMGSWTAAFFDDRGWDVAVHDPDADESVPLDRADDFDVVVIAVPIDVTEDVIADVAPRLTDGLLMDVTSVKAAPVEAMLARADDDVEVLGTHPMFGPSVRSVRGQTVILVEGRPGPLADEIEAAFRDAGANVQFAGAEEHDEMMSVVQGLTHYAYIAIGRALERLDFDIDESRRFMSPVYEVMVDFVGRILHQNPRLYADIQTNQPVEPVHEALLASAEELHESVEADDVEGFVATMQRAARHYGDTRSAHRRSDKLIEASVSEYEALHDSVGEEVGLRHVYSDVVHVGVLQAVEGRELRLDERGSSVTLHTENVELMSDDEVAAWKAAERPRRAFDVSAQFPATLDEGLLSTVAANAHEAIVDAAVVDVYEGEAIPEGATSYTLRIETVADETAEAGAGQAVIDAVERRLEGLGGTIR